MNAHHVRRVAGHDLALLSRNPRLLGSAAFGLSIVLLLVLANVRHNPQADLAPFFFFALIGAAVGVPFSAAIHAVVGEKERRTMEPLLLLPISPATLAAGKVLASLALSTAGILAVFAGGAVGTAMMRSAEGWAALTDPRTLYTAIVLAPLTVLPFSLLGMAVSARAPDAQTASAVSFAVLLPLWALLAGVWLGVVGVNQRFLLQSTLALPVLAFAAFRVATWALDPEKMIRRRG